MLLVRLITRMGLAYCLRSSFTFIFPETISRSKQCVNRGGYWLAYIRTSRCLRRAVIDRYMLPAGQQQQFVRVGTDRRADIVPFIDPVLHTMRAVPITVIVFLCNFLQSCNYTGWAKKTGLFFRLDNFVVVSPRKACSMSKFSQFYGEKRYKTRISMSLNILCQICSNHHNS